MPAGRSPGQRPCSDRGPTIVESKGSLEADRHGDASPGLPNIRLDSDFISRPVLALGKSHQSALGNRIVEKAQALDRHHQARALFVIANGPALDRAARVVVNRFHRLLFRRRFGSGGSGVVAYQF